MDVVPIIYWFISVSEVVAMQADKGFLPAAAESVRLFKVGGI